MKCFVKNTEKSPVDLIVGDLKHAGLDACVPTHKDGVDHRYMEIAIICLCDVDGHDSTPFSFCAVVHHYNSFCSVSVHYLLVFFKADSSVRERFRRSKQVTFQLH